MISDADSPYIIITGDLNADVSDHNHGFGRELSEFCSEEV